MKKRILYSLIASIFIVGCGENSSLSDSNINYTSSNIFSAQSKKIEYTDYTINAVDDPIEGADVSAIECNSSVEIGDGRYILKNCVSKPSFIEVKNGVIKNRDINQSFPLIINTKNTFLEDGFVISPVSAILADANESVIKEFANKLGVDENELFSNPDNPKLKKIFPKLNAILIKAQEDGVVSNKFNFLKVVREKVLSNLQNGDFNLTKVAKEIELVSQKNPAMFGIIFIGDLSEKKDILEEIKDIQHPTKVKFLGLVFDKKISNADIRVYRSDNNETFVDNIKTDENGKWDFNLTDNKINEINNEDFILILEAKKGDITLTSTLSSLELRKLIKNSKNLTPSKNPQLIISNITTVKHAILKKRGALDSSKKYSQNLSDINTYHKDKIVEAAAVLKDIVDNNNTQILDNNDTFSFVYKSIENANDVNLSSSITDANTTVPKKELEKNITSNSIFLGQINYVPQVENKNGFEEASKKAGYTFYRLLAYYQNGVFKREYDKIITLAGDYEVKKCFIEGNNTKEWRCEQPYTITSANFNSGEYKINDNGKIINYSLDKNNSIYVSKLCKNYKIYQVSKKIVSIDGSEKIIPEVLVDSFDVVDMFRRMPKEDKKSFNDLKDRVNNKTRDEANIELNKFVKDQINNTDKYFSDSNTQCKKDEK